MTAPGAPTRHDRQRAQTRRRLTEAGRVLITEKGVETLGTEGGALMSSPGGGSSAIFGPDGRRLSEPLDDKTEGIIYAYLNMDELVKVRMFADCTGHYSRPDLLWLGVAQDTKKVLRVEGVEGTVEVRTGNGSAE